MKLSPEDVNVIAKYLYMEMLKAGYTCVAEFHYLHHQQNGMAYDDPAEMSHQVIEAAKSAGIGLTHLPVLYTYAGFGQKLPQQSQARFIHQTENYCRLIESLCQSVKGEELISFGVAPHSLRAVSKEQLDTLIPFTKLLDPKAPIHIHIAEQLKEVDDCLAHYGKRPVQWLLESYQTDSTWCLVHATHLSDTEMSRIVDAGAKAGICPTTEANLGDGIFPTNAFLNLG